MALTDNRRNRRSSQRKRCRPGTHSLTGARPFAGSKEKPPEARPGQARQAGKTHRNPEPGERHRESNRGPGEGRRLEDERLNHEATAEGYEG